LKTAEGTVVMEKLNAYILGLPQQESNFKIISINPEAFSTTFQGFANILKIDINPKYSKPSFKVVQDIYAHPQTVVYLTAPDGKAMADMVVTRSQQIIDLFVNAELKKEQANLRRTYSDKVRRQVQQQFGYDIYAPKEINAVKPGKDFMWASSNQLDNRLNICVYTYPYASDEGLSEEHYIAIRDWFMRQNIQGEHAGQYMKTNPDFVFIRTITVNGHQVMEARGLWEMENDMMGGPFVSLTRLDQVNGRVVRAEAFLFAAGQKKRNALRQQEAILYTLKMPNER
jgi:hypothetical protein